MFEDVGENDDVELASGERMVLQIGVNDLAHARTRDRHRLRARLDSRDAVTELLDVLRSRGEAAADIEDVQVLSSAPKAEQPPIHILEVLIVRRFIHRFYLRESAKSADSFSASTSALSMHTSLLM